VGIDCSDFINIIPEKYRTETSRELLPTTSLQNSASIKNLPSSSLQLLHIFLNTQRAR
jgi:hypothetical protein